MSSDMYNTYDNETFSYYTSSTFDNRTKEYLISRYTPTASCDYGDTVNITFDIIDNENDFELSGKYILVNFYNFRFEKLPIFFTVEAQNSFTINLTYSDSINYFVRGTYYCSLDLVGYNAEEEITSSQTILSMKDCCFYVQ